MSDFGQSFPKQEGAVIKIDPWDEGEDEGEDTTVWMELSLSTKLSREEVHTLVDTWLTENNWE